MSEAEEQDRRERPPRTFAATDTWVFDLDNTLYPAECNLFAEIDRRMGEFVARLLGVPFEQARHLQKTYYRQFGTTLNGLMLVHKLDPKPFLDYVHDIDLAPVPESPELAAAIERVAGKLGVLHLFEDICDIESSAYVPKPDPVAYERMLKAHAVEPQRAAMFEDMPHNLEAPHALGMTTVLVHSTYMDHPIQQQIKSWNRPPAHVHHMTENLRAFLEAIAASRAD
jgi:putative hydrolase of the HAD superfamily